MSLNDQSIAPTIRFADVAVAINNCATFVERRVRKVTSLLFNGHSCAIKSTPAFLCTIHLHDKHPRPTIQSRKNFTRKHFRQVSFNKITATLSLVRSPHSTLLSHPQHDANQFLLPQQLSRALAKLTPPFESFKISSSKRLI